MFILLTLSNNLDGFEAAVVNVKVEFNYNCSKIIPDDPNSVIGSIRSTQSYNKDMSCANLNFSFIDMFDFEINGTTTQTKLSLIRISITPQNGIKTKKF